MGFSGQYLTYEEYIRLNGTLDIAPFNILEFEARKQIDKYTFNRLKGTNSNEIPQEVKMCEFKMINSLNNYVNSVNEVTNNGNVASENTDGYSVSYLTIKDISSILDSKSKELETIIKTYLLHVIFNEEHLLYCGVD